MSSPRGKDTLLPAPEMLISLFTVISKTVSNAPNADAAAASLLPLTKTFISFSSEATSLISIVLIASIFALNARKIPTLLPLSPTFLYRVIWMQSPVPCLFEAGIAIMIFLTASSKTLLSTLNLNISYPPDFYIIPSRLNRSVSDFSLYPSCS